MLRQGGGRALFDGTHPIDKPVHPFRSILKYIKRLLYVSVMVEPPETWRAAVCVDSPNISRAVRRALDDLGWDYERDRSQHHFSKLIFFVTIPQMSYVFQFLVRAPI